VALLVLAAATLLAVQMRRPRPADPLVGHSLPPLDAAGWLNSNTPLTAKDVRGQIVAIDFWASWCSECALDLPKLIAFHQRYRDKGVVLVGLTDEPATDLDKIERFIHREEGVDWPIAYGAWLAYQMTGIEGLPTYVLYDRTGVSVWSGATVEDLEDAVVALLAKE
jgi:thiol-disulfide isomerase/thioredoxin